MSRTIAFVRRDTDEQEYELIKKLVKPTLDFFDREDSKQNGED